MTAGMLHIKHFPDMLQSNVQSVTNILSKWPYFLVSLCQGVRMDSAITKLDVDVLSMQFING